MEYKHFILTPYCVKFKPYHERDRRLRTSQEWLDKRLTMFRDFCLPSVRAQSNQDFTWVLFFDPDISSDYIAKVKGLIEGSANIQIAYCDGYDDVAAMEAVRELGIDDAKWVLTTRFDNDDALHKDFVKVLHESLTFDQRRFYNFSTGIIYFEDRFYYYRHASNAFISFLEPSSKFTTVWCGSHPTLGSIAPVTQIVSIPGFMQLVHQRTRSNKPRGFQIPNNVALQGFETLSGLDHLRHTNPSGKDIFTHNVSTALGWGIRDWAINQARAAARTIYPNTQSVADKPAFLRRLIGQ